MPSSMPCDIGIHDADSIQVILEHRRESPVGLFSLDGRPHLKTITVYRNQHFGLPDTAHGGRIMNKTRNEVYSTRQASSETT